MKTAKEGVPVRTILTTIGVLLMTVLAILLVMQLARVLVWVVVAMFFTAALHPAVRLAEHRLHVPRLAATTVVFFIGLLVLAGLVTVFVIPLSRQATQLVTQLPDYVAQAREGRGPVGDLVQRFDIDEYLRRNSDQLQPTARNLSGPVLGVAQTVAITVVGVLTVAVLTFLMLLQAPRLLPAALQLLAPQRRVRVERVGRDCASAVTGYVVGQLSIVLICGLLTFLVLTVLGVPFAGVIAVFVTIADLVPLVGATVGAIVAGGIAFLHSVTAGIVVVIFFLVYQQVENHLLQPLIQSRTVHLNPLTVLLSVIVGVELAGILGALLAIPAAGVIQVVVRDVWDHRRGRPKDEPTVGPDEVPASLAQPQEAVTPV